MYKEFALKHNLEKRIEEITVELTSILSVTETSGEREITQRILEIFQSMDYYKEHPEDVYLLDAKGDRFNRNNVVAILRGKKGNNKKTVSLLGHIDTVGISDYGTLIDYANKPYELTEKMRGIVDTLPNEVQEDLKSTDENYLFGRGIFDMKCGDAILIALIEALSKDIENFEGNLIFTGVCDEEVGSAGMFALVEELNRLVEVNGWEIQGMIDTDYMTNEYHGDKNKYVYVGAVGKLMPTFFVVGKETHVGESFNGLDPNLIVAELTRRIDMNTKFCDEAMGQVTLPPITLKQRDLKPEYSVQIAKTATLFFNYATHKSTPDEVMSKMIVEAKDAMQDVIDYLNTQYEHFCELSKIQYKKLPWVTNVMSYEDLYAEVKKELGDKLDKIISDYEKEILDDKLLDERDFALKLVEKVHSLWSNRDPVVITYLSPPYYPHIFVEGKNDKELNVLNAVRNAVNDTKTDYNLVYKNFFSYIADISFAAAPSAPGAIDYIKNNMPGFGSKYIMPIDEMAKLNIPVLDIGPFGKDAHKFTERLEKGYSFSVAPELVYRTILNLLK